MKHIWKILGIGGAVVLVVNLFGLNPLGWITAPLFEDDDPPAAADTTLLSIAKTQDLRAATGEFSVPVYFGTEQNGLVKGIVPDAFDANSGIALYQGSVDALVDLSGLTQDDIVVESTTRRVTITVPEPVLSRPNIDPSKSKVVSQNRGLLTRLGELFSESPMQGKEALDGLAIDELTDAALESNLTEIGRENTRDFLTALGRELGYTDVTIVFEEPRSP
ncbi:MAG: DUF4230 domain-containing protein [Actinobacteria bacterium]|nr:DUF4230 domain-containing protein [Actinomycetota bacterium]